MTAPAERGTQASPSRWRTLGREMFVFLFLDTSVARRWHRAVTSSRLGLALFVALFLGLGGLGWNAVAGLRGALRRTQCWHNEKAIALALHAYHDEHGSFPPAVTYGPDGKAWHSWRALILPYLRPPHLTTVDVPDYRFDEPWDGPHNTGLLDAGPMPHVFRCPADDDPDPAATSYLAVVGEGTMWPPGGVTTRRDAADGTGKTLMAVEVAGSGVKWTEPRDLLLDEMTFAVDAETGVGLRGRHGVAYGLFVDGGFQSFLPDTPPETLKSLLLRDDGGPEEVP